MHEATAVPVVVTQPSAGKTVTIEEGEDGIQVGELEVTIKNGKLKEWEWKRHLVNQDVEEDEDLADNVLVSTPGNSIKSLPFQKTHY